MWSLCLEGLIFFTSDASILIDICSFILTLSNLNSGNQKVLRCHTLLRRQSFSLFFISFLKVGQPRPLFVYFRSIQTQYYRKNVGFSGIRTRIFRVVGKHADHLTTTTVPLFFISLSILSRSLRFFVFSHFVSPMGTCALTLNNYFCTQSRSQLWNFLAST